MKQEDLTKFSGKAFKDFLIRLGKNPSQGREKVSLKTRISRHITANIPLVSANMLDITEATMAIAFARMGGLGVIHKDWSIDRQAQEVAKVKRAQNCIIENPHCIPASENIQNAINFMDKEGIGGILVTDENGRLAGIITTRDVKFSRKIDKDLVKEFMTPRESLIVGNSNTTTEEAWQVFQNKKIEKLPLVDEDFKITGLISLKDTFNLHRYPQINLDKKGKLVVGAAIGATGDYLERAKELLKAGANIIFMDIKSGHSEIGLNAIRESRKRLGGFELVAGNVATSEAVSDFINEDVDGVKIGYGPGGACTSRIVTGCGVVQMEAIVESYWNQIFKFKRDPKDIPPLGADGGIRSSGDANKALLGGASWVMVGTYVAGTYQTPGPVLRRIERKTDNSETLIEKIVEYKEYRGEASEFLVGERIERSGREKNAEEIFSRTPEGTKKQVDLSGSVYDKLRLMIGGIQSGISDAGYMSLEEAKNNFDPATQFGSPLSVAGQDETYNR